MKKLVGPMCSFLAGVLCFVFLSIPYFITKVTAEGVADVTNTENAWQMLKNYDSTVNGYMMFKVATIIMIVFASLLIVWSIILALYNFDMFKFDFVNFNLMNTLVLFMYMVAVVVQMIAILMMMNFIGATVAGVVTRAYGGVGLWLNLATSIITFLSALLFTKSVRLLQDNK